MRERRVVAWLAAVGGPDAVGWWAALEPEVRGELTGRWSALPPAADRPFVEALPVPPDDVDGPGDPGGWNRDLYEHLVDHPELNFSLDRRVFHICTAHPAARAVLRAGRLPERFRCPLGRAGCPLRELIRAAGGRDVRLRRASVRDRP